MFQSLQDAEFNPVTIEEAPPMSKFCCLQKRPHYILFFDDTYEHCTGVSKSGNVISFHVVPKKENFDLSKEANICWGSNNMSGMHCGAGFTVYRINVLTNFIANSNYISTICFDWDQTLSVCNACPKKFFEKSDIDVLAECYFGGQRRMLALKELFSVLEKKKINVCIISNNPILLKDPDNFLNLFRTFTFKDISFKSSINKNKMELI